MSLPIKSIRNILYNKPLPKKKIRTEINNLPPDRRARYYAFIGPKLFINNELEDTEEIVTKQNKSVSLKNLRVDFVDG